MATIEPATFLGEPDTLGTIEEGKIARLILLKANLLEDISNSERIDAVTVNGRFFPKAVLHMMLANVEKAANPR